MPEMIRFADGTELTDSHVMKVSEIELYVYIQQAGITFRGAFAILDDAEMTREIRFRMIDGTDMVYTGYTELTCLRKESAEMITAILRRTAGEVRG